MGNFQSPELGSISGVKFQDDNQSGFQDPEELGLPGFRIYLDQNNNNTFELDEPNAITNTDGTYTINNIPAGNYTVREVQQTGFTQTTPDPIVTVVADQNISNINFGNFQQETVDAFIVNSIGDEGDANLNDGVPLTATGVVTLRSAIEQANFLPGENTIDFDPNILFGQTITLNTQLDITSDIIINGLGANNLTISGNNASRVFNIQAPPPPIIDAPILNALQLNIVSPTVTISGLTITDGVVSNEQGGGIRNIEGNVTLANSTVTGNTAISGGGVYTRGGTLTIGNSLIYNNTASFGAGIINNNTFAPDAYGNSILVNTGVLEVNNTTISNNIATNAELSGGGIDNDGTVTVTDSTISGNTSGFDGGGIYNNGTATVTNSSISENVASRFGGGIANDSTVTVTNSTISGNSTNASGGGIANDSTVTVTNSTISGNSTNVNGGGIYNNGRNTFYDGINFIGATATITNSTITQNIADNDGDNIGNGGGIANGGTANVSNSIIAGNFDASSTIILSDVSENFNDTLVGVFNSNDSNLVGDILGSSGFAPSEVLQVPVSSVLDPNLVNNGGLTLTHALIQDINNPAIDGENNANILPGVQFDQRGNGFPRTLDGDGDGIAVVDVGAFEASQIETELLVNISGTKFNDLDNDGSLDIGEPSLPGVTVYIDINNNNFPDNDEPTAVTDAFGFYSFNNISLLPDTYNIRDIPPTGFIQAAPIPTITVDIASTNFPNFNIANIEVSSFIVNDTRDAGDLIPGNGIVETALGDNIVTLRAAIEEANAFPGENTIEFESSLSGQTITLSNVELDITSNIIINGLGANNLTISGNNASRIFDIQESTVTINDLAIADGFVFGEEEGGGIRNIGGIVTVNNSTIRNSQGFNGGGISNRDGVLTVNNSTVSGNNSSGNGGAISSQGGADGELTINNSTISGNTSIGLGGGIYINTPASISDIASNTIVLNTAIDGGGVFIAGGATRIEQSIIVGNNSNNVSGSFLGIENVIDVPIESVLETALQNNGGPTETHNLIPGSPAIDIALGNTFNLDQRGIQRPIDGDGDGNAIADIGAVETSQITLVGSISGIKFNDLDSDGFFDAGEPGLAGVTIYLDLNENQQFDPEEPSEITNDTGNYSFSNLNSGSYNVREVVPENFRPTLAPETPITITAAGENFTNINFGNTTNIAGISITQTGGSTDVAEEGTTSDTYEIALNSIPTAPVNITIASDGQTVLSDVDETLSNTINLTFNDLTPQTVTVTAVDDEIESPDISNITHTISSNDENYNGANVPFTIDDIPSNNILPVNIIDSDIENLAPDAIDDTAFTTVNNQVNIDVLDNDTDPELDQIDIIDFDATSTAGGTVTLSTDENENPSLLYFPPNGFIGEDTFTYTISDGNNNTDIATVTINVISPGEQRPIANSDTATTTQGNPVTINVLENDTDPQDSPVEILATTDPSNGAIANNNNGTITYTPLPEAIGEDTFTYTIIDPEGNISEPATVTVAVDPLPPGSISGTIFDDLNNNEIIDPGETGLNNVTVTISGIENDIPIQQTTVTDSSGIYNFSNLLPNIEYTLTAVRSPDLPLQEFPFPVTIPAGESVSNINFAYDVSDPGILQFSEPIFSVAENTPTATVTIIRTDGSDGVVSATLNLANGTAIQDIDYGNPISNNIFFADGETQQTVSIPIIDDSIIEGNRTVNLSLSNITGEATIGQPATAILEILEDEVSPPPIANPDTATTTQGNPPITIDVLANDTGESLNIITVDNFTTAGNNATINNNQIIYTPLPEFSGTDTFTYEISDGNNNTPNSSATVTITVTPNQVVPIAENDTASTTANTPITIDVLANDTGESLNIITVDNFTTAGNNATINNNQIIYTPLPEFSGTDTFTYEISDGNNNTPNSSATVTITVTPNQVVPIAENDTASTTANTPITIDVLANDTGESLNIITVDNFTTAGNNATINNNQIIYTPLPEFSGTDTFTYEISDGNNNTPNSSATVTITVTPNQVVPIAENDTASTTANTPITIDVLANDTGESLNIITVDNFTTAGNNATINNNQIIYTPLPEFSGTDTFTYEISDGNNNTPNSSATVNVTVDSPPSGSISGIIFNDTNQNGFLELGETALSGVTVFIDTNQNGIPDPNEQTAVTNQSGLYTLSNLLPNTYTVRTITPQPDATLTTQEFSVTLSSGENLNNIDFGYSTANPGILQFSNPTFSVTENEPTATVTVIRTGGNDGVVSANINLSNGTATQGIDYGNPVPETIFFADEQTQQTINIPIVNDNSVENTETVNLSLSNATGGATIGQPATLEIIDDDEIISSPPPPFTTRVLGFDGEFNNFDFVRSVQVNPPQGPANLRFSPNTVALVSRNQGGQGRFDGTTNNSTVIAYDIPDQQLGFELDAIVIDLAEVIERIGEIEFGNFSLDYASPNRSHNVRFFNESRQDIGQGATLSRTIPVPGQPNNFSNFSRQGISIPEDTQFIAIGSESTEIGIDNLQFTLQPKGDSDRSFSQISLASMPDTQLVGNITTIDSLLDSMFFASAI
ncbi:Ig-like domain-containing protein [Okeania sp. SIO2G4]|uniref:Ig-like domain-containing protein n=3 Tax=unclassified Okeania TaxID=2634635 RepID=UPI00257BA0C8|nr:Ig-like domain-containing protein [Okeania sp. SIO2G4]